MNSIEKLDYLNKLYGRPFDGFTPERLAQIAGGDLADVSRNEVQKMGGMLLSVFAELVTKEQPKATGQLTSLDFHREYVDDVLSRARTEAHNAMARFPQPNYVLNKVAEESGEVIKAGVHYTEGRETWQNVEKEVVQAIAMLIRLIVEGDGVIGLMPPHLSEETNHG